MVEELALCMGAAQVLFFDTQGERKSEYVAKTPVGEVGLQKPLKES
jgi:hypothetical protein